MKTRSFLTVAAAAMFVVGACSGGASPSASSAASSAPTDAPPASADTGSQAPATTAPEAASVRLQLQWTPQAQFAGYFAADSQGFYEAEGLTVEMVDGGPTIAPHTVGSAPDGPEFTISWVPKVLEAREQGSDLVNIAQVFQRSGTLSVTWKDSGIVDPCGFAGKKVGVWDFGNEFEVTAAAKQAGLEAGTDFEKIIQPFDMTLLLSRQIDVAEAMIYNEYAQVLEAPNPETGELYQPTDLNVINWNDEGVAMLQD
ncbi:MAG TPA: ABC transporter substrate-binding protein, partial [Candidatus Limnocylindrales bacterium]